MEQEKLKTIGLVLIICFMIGLNIYSHYEQKYSNLDKFGYKVIDGEMDCIHECGYENYHYKDYWMVVSKCMCNMNMSEYI